MPGIRIDVLLMWRRSLHNTSWGGVVPDPLCADALPSFAARSETAISGMLAVDDVSIPEPPGAEAMGADEGRKLLCVWGGAASSEMQPHSDSGRPAASPVRGAVACARIARPCEAAASFDGQMRCTGRRGVGKAGVPKAHIDTHSGGERGLRRHPRLTGAALAERRRAPYTPRGGGSTGLNLGFGAGSAGLGRGWGLRGGKRAME